MDQYRSLVESSVLVLPLSVVKLRCANSRVGLVLALVSINQSILSSKFTLPLVLALSVKAVVKAKFCKL